MTAASGNNVPLIAVVGPTGSGKSSLAHALAAHLETEIISVDSMQFYSGMEIGTAAPTLAAQQQIPHHFVSFLRPDEEITAGSYQLLARERVALINDGGHSAIAVGGSGMYVSALIDGIFDGPGEDPDVRSRLHDEAARLGNDALLARLRAVDPEYASRITGANDLVRIVRALEVYEVSGRPFSELHREHRERTPSLPTLQVALDYPDRQALYDRINRRVVQMVDDGWVDEVQALLDEGFGPELERLKALGYREMVAHLRGAQSLDDAIAAAQQHHRRYAKRQLTWFRADPRIHWLSAGPDTTTASQLAALLQVLDTETKGPAAEETRLHGFLAGRTGESHG